MTRRLLTAVTLCVLASPSQSGAQQQVENLAAFARLYGVARWFYPSDAAAGLDWNRFAITGVRRVRDAGTSEELATILQELFTPLGPGIVIGTSLPPLPPAGQRDPSLIAWHHRGPGFTETPSAYSSKRTNRSSTQRGQAPAGLVTIAQIIRADSLRGKTIRMRGQMRVADLSAAGWAGLLVRVDRPGGTGFFDNMQDRPVRDTAWREYVIEGPVADDATQIIVGGLAVGSTTADVDAIEISARDSAGAWTPFAIPDASFEAAASGPANGWVPNNPSAISRPTNGASHGAQFARLAPAPAGGSTPSAAPSDSLETPRTGEAIDVSLSLGLRARVPLSLTDAEARLESPRLAALQATLGSATTTNDDASVAIADVVVAWSVFRHFYPYWSDLSVDWDARLGPQIQNAMNSARTREAHLDVLRAVVAELQDGHGNVRAAAATAQWILPVRMRIIDGQLVVTASSDTTAPVGSVVTAIGGTSAEARVARETQLNSGTPQWKRERSASALLTCRSQSTVPVSLQLQDGETRHAQLPCDRSIPRAVESRPDSISELAPGYWYVDLTRVRAAQLRPMLDTIAKARGVVFDLRGYPTDAGSAILPYLMRTPEDVTDRWMHVPRFARPFGDVAAWQSMTWNVQPVAPHIAGQRVFLTDGRAISYAESVMGYVRDYKLGTIIGGSTAGANGNIATFSVPGGFTVTFTGMRVTRHDGTTRYHTDGVSPDIPLAPTLADIRTGRDTLLERALATLRGGAMN